MILLDSAQFISDLHLSSERPDILRRFLEFMHGPAHEAPGLFVLGDLFEYWPGDDLLDQDSADGECSRIVLTSLAEYSASGRFLYLLVGNRDFLIDRRFCRETGASLLHDGELARISNRSIEVLHGDALCTDDREYQQFKLMVRSTPWREQFLAKPLAERHAAMTRMRIESEQTKSNRAPTAMNVNPDAVAREFARTSADLMVHGHTHQPACNLHPVGTRTLERWVLPAWYESIGYLRVDAAGVQLISLTGN